MMILIFKMRRLSFQCFVNSLIILLLFYLISLRKIAGMRCRVCAMPKPQPDQSWEDGTQPLDPRVSKFHILSGRHLADLQSSVHHVFWQLYHLSRSQIKSDQTHNISQSFSTSIPNLYHLEIVHNHLEHLPSGYLT